MAALADWRDFYVMIGTASGAIVGATFIVATLAQTSKNPALGVRGFISPTTVHLGSVLVGSAILAAPTLTPLALTALLGSGGIAGTVYSVVAFSRIRHLTLDFADRCFYVALPLIAYIAMAAAATMARWTMDWTLDLLAVALVLLLVIGMRNAWDMTTFMVMGGPRDGEPPGGGQ